MEKDKNSLETLLVSGYIHEIQIAKSLLQTKGIETFIFDENINNVYGGAIGGYKLKINANKLEKALEILQKARDENNLNIA